MTAGICDRIFDARSLWEQNRKDSAIALILIAAAAVSRMRYPRKHFTDKEAFKKFIRDEFPTITGGAAVESLTLPKTCDLPEIQQTENVPIEDVFYSCWRCCMVHEAKFADEISFTPTNEGSRWRWTIEAHPDGTWAFPEEWLLNLAKAVEESAEVKLPELLEFPCFILMKHANQMADGMMSIDASTQFPKMKVRNEDAFPIFTHESLLQKFVGSQDCQVGRLDSAEQLAQLLLGKKIDRVIFNPSIGDWPLPTYWVDCLLAALDLSEAE